MRVGGAWDLLVSGEGAGAFQMALDEAMMDAVLVTGRPLLRLYRFRPKALSLGRAQDTSEVYLPGVAAIGADLIRRPSGGKAVLHDDEVTYAIAAPTGLFPPGVEASYGVIAGALIKAARRLGVNAALSEPAGTPGDLSANCFIHPSVHEIAVDGKKAIGSAQVRRRGVLLQHGAVPVRLRFDEWAACFAPPESRAVWAKAMAERSTGLFQSSGAPSWEMVALAVRDAFSEHFGITWHPLAKEEERRLEAAAKRRQGAFDLSGALTGSGKVVSPWKS